MLFDDLDKIHSYDYIIYVPYRDCNMKHNIYLLYEKQPKDKFRNYSIRIDVFRKNDLIYYTSWYLRIPFKFLPVNRINTRVQIPAQPIQLSKNCRLKCVHGQCTKYGNIDGMFCRCSEGWMGYLCNLPHLSNCAKDSICIGSIGNRSICICPMDRFGRRCLLRNNVCSSLNPCKHNGQCIPLDDRISENKFICLCHEGFSGPTCETMNTRISISFKEMPIPQGILAHLIRVDLDKDPVRSTLFKRIAYDTDKAILYSGYPFHIVFIEIFHQYYLSVVQEIYRSVENLPTEISPSRRCASINELFNDTIIQYDSLRRIKWYHVPCQARMDLVCFYDEKFMCLCDLSRHANCFEFEHNMNYNCHGHNYCENNGQCFEDDAICPTISFCMCPDCFYGRQCQLSTQGFDLSLDAIIGYSIYPNVIFSHQSNVVKVTVTLTVIIYIIGLINGILSLITFRAKSLQKVGSGIYLFIASIVALFHIHLLIYKVLFLILSQMSLIRNVLFLRLNCTIVDFLLKIFSNSGSWLSACVAIERTVCIWKKTKFNQMKSQYIAKWIITCVFLLTILSTIPDPIYRRLIEDSEEQRLWCIVKYSEYLKIYMSIMNIFHFLVPFIINVISAIMIIILVARTRSVVHKKKAYKEHLREQFYEHKHLLITPCVLILLTLPHLIKSLSSNCMKSSRDPWLFLIGYFIAFTPFIFTFVLFVVPSDVYMKQFQLEIKRNRT